MADDSVVVDINGNTEGFDEAVGGMQGTISSASVAMGNMLSDLGKKALSSFGDMIASGDQFNQAINQMSASTGATGAELEGLRDVVKDVYGNNFGESYDDAANAVAEVSKQTGLMGEELQKATEGAFALGDTFGYEVSESTRAASSMMENFGISADEAYNLIAVGAKNGADQNDNLLDTLNEYSGQYAALGLSAEQFTTSLITGAQEGAFDIDKVGDAVKEFNIRAKDGSTSSAEAFAAIGMSAEDMTAKFAAGGDTAQQAFFEVVNALDRMEDPVAKNAAAVGLFGTQYEDLEANLLPMLQSMTDTSGVAYDALGQINEVKYDDVGSAVEGLKRTIGKATIDIRSNLSGGLADAIGGFVTTLQTADGDPGKIFDGLVEAGKTALDAVAPVLEGWIENGKTIIDKIVTGIQENLPIIKEKAQEILQMLLDGVVSKANMIVEIGLPLLQSLIQGISDNAAQLVEAAKTLLTGLIQAVTQALPILLPMGIELLKSVIQAIIEALPMLLTAATDIIEALIDGLTAALTLLTDYLPEIITAIVTFLTENLTPLVEAAIQIIMALLNGILDNLDMLIQAAIDLVFALVDALVDNLDPLIDAAMQIIDALINYLLDGDNLEKLIEMGLTICCKIGSGLAKAAFKLLGGIWEIRDTIINKLKEVDWLELGKNILEGIANGLKNGISMLGDVVDEVAGDLWNGFKDFFGIASPSKLMRDTVGKFLLPGVAVGMEGTASETADDMNKALDDVMNRMDTTKLQAKLDAAVQTGGYSGLVPVPEEVRYHKPRSNTAEEYRQQPTGDIIIPVSIGGTQLETLVVKSAQIANARSGGETI